MKYQQIEEQITKYIEKVGWSEPTPIQRKAIPVVLRGRHTLIVAPTGSGKTEAAVIPIFTVLSGKNLKQKGVRVLYITPLRALNRDIFRRLIHYAEERGLKITYGLQIILSRARIAKILLSLHRMTSSIISLLKPMTVAFGPTVY